jgi:hypothetical protein
VLRLIVIAQKSAGSKSSVDEWMNGTPEYSLYLCRGCCEEGALTRLSEVVVAVCGSAVDASA